MNTTDPQFIYMALILPSMFGFTLVGEGVYKITQEHTGGWFTIIMGITFIGIVVAAFYFVSGSFNF